ncbi:MAG: DUF3459 domain-containing protein [Thermomicrobia bacterium]|nr:DUF3459 domain-containing protein [Thermomicrobia bacterium]
MHPFQYFTSHGDAALIAAVRAGRRAEFDAFRWEGAVPDPDDPATFLRSTLTHREHEVGVHGTLWQFYQEALRLRQTRPALAALDLASLAVHADEATKTLTVRRWAGDDQALALFNFSDLEQIVTVAPSPTPWHILLDSADKRWRGPGSTIPAILPPNGATVTLSALSVALFGT